MQVDEVCKRCGDRHTTEVYGTRNGIVMESTVEQCPYCQEEHARKERAEKAMRR
jgi:RNA polymerase subunit RPABC4/transcription elongation factor Spt4